MFHTGSGNILIGNQSRLECPNLLVEEGGRMGIDGTVLSFYTSWN